MSSILVSSGRMVSSQEDNIVSPGTYFWLIFRWETMPPRQQIVDEEDGVTLVVTLMRGNWTQ